MPSSPTEVDVQQLSVPQRLDLIARLWDSIPDTAEAIPVPTWHQQELERRLAAADADPGAAEPWEQVRARLRSKS
jgi:putative addiction module component (TIGR02574 family)